jgi:hypothetical protein
MLEHMLHLLPLPPAIDKEATPGGADTATPGPGTGAVSDNKRKMQNRKPPTHKHCKYTGVAVGPWGLPATFYPSLRIDLDALQVGSHGYVIAPVCIIGM